MEFSHIPVMLNECLHNLKIKPNGVYLDGTLGGAGHSREIYKRLNYKGMLIGIDRDETALKASEKVLQKTDKSAGLILEKSNFSNMKQVCENHGIEWVDGILLDLGVSSHQLDEPDRGFGYMNDSALDMRMDRQQEFTAWDVVNKYTEKQLLKAISDYGEEKWAVRIASFIVKARVEKNIDTTAELVDIIKKAIPAAARREGPHPAKRTFQAIRIEVNGELKILADAVHAATEILNPGGRLVIITFHSLEDRIIKNAFQKEANPCTCPHNFPQCICGLKPSGRIITRKPITPDENEININPRSRSAKVRVFEKGLN